MVTSTWQKSWGRNVLICFNKWKLMFTWNHHFQQHSPIAPRGRDALQQRWCLQGPLLGQLKHVENNHNKTAFQASCVFRSSNSLFPKAHLFLSDTVVGLIKSSTWTPGFASLLRTLQCQRQCLFVMWSLLVMRQAGSSFSLLPSLQGQLSGKHCLSKREHCQGLVPSRKNLVFSAGTRKLNCANDRKIGPCRVAGFNLAAKKETACNAAHLKVVSGVGRQMRSAVVVGVVWCHLWPGVVGHWRVCIFNCAVQCREGRSLSKQKERVWGCKSSPRKLTAELKQKLFKGALCVFRPQLCWIRNRQLISLSDSN